MGGLPRPDLPPGPQRELVDALHDLHLRAGWPSLRTLAREAGCSHTTVSHVFSTARLPAWGVLELVVEALGGDTARFHDLWLAAGRDAEGPATGARPAIAGRREELRAVRRHLEAGNGLMLLVGEAGIGKTRLATAAADSADGVEVLTGHCLHAVGRRPAPADGDGAAGGARDRRRDVAGAGAGRVPGIRRGVPQAAAARAGAGADRRRLPEDGWSRQRLMSAIRTVLEALSRVRRMAVVLEDLHWADTATLAVLEHLANAGSGPPLLGTFRLDEHDDPRRRDGVVHPDPARRRGDHAGAGAAEPPRDGAPGRAAGRLHAPRRGRQAARPEPRPAPLHRAAAGLLRDRRPPAGPAARPAGPAPRRAPTRVLAGRRGAGGRGPPAAPRRAPGPRAGWSTTSCSTACTSCATSTCSPRPADDRDRAAAPAAGRGHPAATGPRRVRALPPAASPRPSRPRPRRSPPPPWPRTGRRPGGPTARSSGASVPHARPSSASRPPRRPRTGCGRSGSGQPRRTSSASRRWTSSGPTSPRWTPSSSRRSPSGRPPSRRRPSPSPAG